jgi:transcriptional regulator with XRE-family HTH domain
MHYPSHIRVLERPNRIRGILLTLQGWQKLQTAIAKSEYEKNFGEKYTIQHLGEHVGIAPGTITKVLNRSKNIDRRTIERIFRTFNLELEPSDYSKPGFSLSSIRAEEHKPVSNTYIDWGKMSHNPVFYRHMKELAILNERIVKDSCRLVALLELMGIRSANFM